MDQPAPSSDTAARDLAAEPPGLLELFLAFSKMSLAGFGGVLVWARRAIVEQHRWMTPDEFNEAFALCQTCSSELAVDRTAERWGAGRPTATSG